MRSDDGEAITESLDERIEEPRFIDPGSAALEAAEGRPVVATPRVQ
jgi:hypothetical protein